jgi:hypothetical protein
VGLEGDWFADSSDLLVDLRRVRAAMGDEFADRLAEAISEYGSSRYFDGGCDADYAHAVL